jgi:hypothetical protein
MTMTPQERDVIAGIFDRLKQAANQPRDPEAEAFIAERLREQPYAPYAMAQAVYVQEQALLNLQAQTEELQAQVQSLQNRPAEPAPQSGGFLSGIFGGGDRPADAPARAGSVPPFPQRQAQAPSGAWSGQARPPGSAPAGGPQEQPQPGPWTNQQAQPPGRGGGFMASALTTAAGVAGGMMLGNVLTNAFGGGKSGEAKATEPEKAADTTAKDDTSTKDDTSAADTQQAAYDQGANDQAKYDQANAEEPYDPGYDDGPADDDGDWA